MPRTLYDENSQPIENLPDEEELKALNEAKGKVETLQKELDEVKQEMNPNWAEARGKMKRMESEIEEWRDKAKKAGVKEDPQVVPREDIERIAEAKATETYLNRYRDRLIGGYGEKADIVREYFGKLAQGEALTEDKIEELVSASAQAAGLGMQRVNPLNRALAAHGGPPVFPKPEGENYADTPQGKATAEAMGLNYVKAKK